MTSVYAPPWSPSYATADTHDISSGDPREWGIDVPLPAGSVIDAPFAGTIAAYQASATDWGPGRLVLTGGPAGETVAFGHVAPGVRVGQKVAAGQPIAVVPTNAEGGPHTEFMLFPTGSSNTRAAAAPLPTIQGYLRSLFASSPAAPAAAPTQAQLASFGLPSAVGGFFGGVGSGIAGIPGDIGNAAGAAANFATGGIAGALLYIPKMIGHGLADFFRAIVDNLGVFFQRQIVALLVAAVVLLVLFG